MKTFSARYRSKAKIHRFLQVRCEAYLCGLDCLTIFFLKSLLDGSKKCTVLSICNTFLLDVKTADVVYQFIPIYESLAISDIMKQVDAYPMCKDYFPSSKDLHRLPRQWIINVVTTLYKEPFQSWVSEAIERRNASLALKQDLWISLDPAVAQAFASSTDISVSSTVKSSPRVFFLDHLFTSLDPEWHWLFHHEGWQQEEEDSGRNYWLRV